MKTPVQELYERLWEAEKDKFVWASILIDVLEKEKEVIKDAFGLYPAGGFIDNEEERVAFEEYYNETFNTKEK